MKPNDWLNACLCDRVFGGCMLWVQISLGVFMYRFQLAGLPTLSLYKYLQGNGHGQCQ